ncbi:MAG: hypothetical protein QOI24_4311 [Acidobacteriota bacterium]|nr:hypothetical protein [Acidobacteriota bacterium]
MSQTVISYEPGPDGVGLFWDVDEEIPVVAEILESLLRALDERPIEEVEWSAALTGEVADPRQRVSAGAVAEAFVTMLTKRAGYACELRTVPGQREYRLYRDACERVVNFGRATEDDAAVYAKVVEEIASRTSRVVLKEL